jgi:hypothetical protein
MLNKLVVTACNTGKYCESARTLIASLHRYAFDFIDAIHVYDLGLSTRDVDGLNKIAKVEVKNPPDYVKNFYDGYLEPKQYAWKMCFIYEARQHAQNILWTDAGIAFLNDGIKGIFSKIETDDIFLVGGFPRYLIQPHCSRNCGKEMEVTPEELSSRMLNASIIGYKSGGKYQEHFVNEGFKWSQIKEAVHGSIMDHRHDQTIYSILIKRCELFIILYFIIYSFINNCTLKITVIKIFN